MPEDHLARAREQAERSEPSVRAAALMHIARAQTAFDCEQARQTFRRALAEARLLPGRESEFLLEQARLLACAVAPDLLSEIPAGRPELRRFIADRLGP